MQFLKESDFNGIIGSSTLTTLKGDDSENLTTAENLAISELDPLRTNFDIDTELAKNNTDRNTLMIRLLVHITAYYLYNTVVDDEIPERIYDNYKMSVSDIQKIATGKLGCTLEPILDETNRPKSNYRFGGDELRDNDIF